MSTIKSRQQVEQLLQDAAAGGNAALVNTRTYNIIVTDGEPNAFSVGRNS